MSEFVPVIGLEVHAELLTNSKMFCGCEVVDTTSAEPNTAVCEICTGMPGTLPVINERAVEYALKVALALHCEIAETSVFARKNYFYPDLPKGFQISQYELPLARNGWLPIDLGHEGKRVRIRRVHIEEDTGKLTHRGDYSLIDYNRSGVPLLEIVSEPDLASIAEVKSYATSLRSLLRYLEVNTGDMEKGVIRFEANVSVRPEASAQLGTRTEIKNLNSFRALLRAVEFEIERQSDILRSGGQVIQETVGWDENEGVTVSQRGKEEAHDYRYFPEPDLPPLRIDDAWLEEIRSNLPELPYQKRLRFIEEYDLSPYTADVLTAEREVAEFFELAASNDVPSTKLANWITSDLFGLLNEAAISLQESKMTPEIFAELVQLVDEGTISSSTAKDILEEMFHQGGRPTAIVEQRGLAQIIDPELIGKLTREVIEENPAQTQTYLDGKSTIIQWFIGQVMHKTSGRADPQVVQQALEKHLGALQGE
jgi:aspartyl-tRNA(Asn)/glutamyl-tRNA(Gln) amidotransferase subunit B